MANRRILLYKARVGHGPVVRRKFDRFDPFEVFNDLDFYQRYRFDKESVRFLVNEFGDGLGSSTDVAPVMLRKLETVLFLYVNKVIVQILLCIWRILTNENDN